MISRHGRITLAVFVALVVVLLSCTLNAAVVKVLVSYNSNTGSCTQTVNHLPQPYVGPLDFNDHVLWVTGNAVNGVYVEFEGSSPFGSTSYGNSDGATGVDSGPAHGAPTNTYHYGRLIVGKFSCNNPGSLGIVMR